MNEVIAKRLALSMALMCVRNICIEDIQAGVEPSSKADDFSDAKACDALWRNPLEQSFAYPQ
jgi:hypothetical protein